jgi:MFS family permease
MQPLTINHNTRQISLAYFFSKCGEFAFETAFAVAVVNLTEADLLTVGIIYFFRYLPSVFISPVGGWFADNLDRKSLLITAELLKSLIAATLFILFIQGDPPITVIVIMSMLMTVSDCLYTTTFRAYLPDMVDRKILPSINSATQVIEDISSIIGPLAFSLVSTLWTTAYVFAFFSISLLASAAYTKTLGSLSKTRTQHFDLINILKESTRNIANLKKLNKPLFSVIFCTTLCAMFATSVIRFVLPTTIMQNYESDAAVGYIYALLSSATVLGGLSYIKFNNTTNARSVITYWLLYGALFLLAAVCLNISSYLFLAFLFCAGFIGAFVDIAIITNIQSLSKPNEIGKNFSLYYLTASFGDAVSGLISCLVFIVMGPATFIGMTFMLCIAPLGWSKVENDINNNSL